MSTHEEPYSDCTVSEAMALHTVVRAMRGGNCPKCSYLGTVTQFQSHDSQSYTVPGAVLLNYTCPMCGFSIHHKEAIAAMQAFAPLRAQNVEMFEAWRKRRSQNL
jgi:hypothetical protein